MGVNYAEEAKRFAWEASRLQSELAATREQLTQEREKREQAEKTASYLRNVMIACTEKLGRHDGESWEVNSLESVVTHVVHQAVDIEQAIHGLIADRDSLREQLAKVEGERDELRKQKHYIPMPSHSVEGADGGIVLEWRGPTDTTIRIWDDGSIEFLRWAGGKITERHTIKDASEESVKTLRVERDALAAQAHQY